MIIGIDPGTFGCGVCVASDAGRIIDAKHVKNFAKGSGPKECAVMARAVYESALGYDITTLVLEYPQIYQREGGKTKGDPNGIMPLAGVDAAIATVFPLANVFVYRPSDWKGQTQKPESVGAGEYIITGRVKSRLDAEELARIVWPVSVKHSYDVADAIGVTLYHVGRFERKKVYARE
jgi:hypothetical protein